MARRMPEPSARLCTRAMSLATARAPVGDAVAALIDLSSGDRPSLESALDHAEHMARACRDRQEYQLGVAFLELALHDLARGLRQPAAV